MKSSKSARAPKQWPYVAGILLAVSISIAGAQAVPIVEPITWSEDIAASLARARIEKRLLLVDVYTDWCSWCERLSGETLADPDVARRLSGYALLKVNPESGDEAAAFAASYAVVGFPTMLVIDGEGELMGAIRGFVTPLELLSRLDTIESAHR